MEVSFFRLLLSLWRSATSLAAMTPLALYHGPFPMRSLALTGDGPPVLRYALHVLLPAPTALASDWQCWSAPARPPRSAPLPDPVLVMKKLIFSDAFCAMPGSESASSIRGAIRMAL